MVGAAAISLAPLIILREHFDVGLDYGLRITLHFISLTNLVDIIELG
jgi:hypothetical protein